MGGIQSVNALPDDPTFNQKDNPYDVASYKRICAEFGVNPSSDFRFTYGKNHGLGNVYIWVAYEGPSSTDYNYPDPDLALFDDERVTDRKDPNYKANGITFVRNDQGADKQFEHFVPNFSQGLTQAGLSRMNQSIEAFVYCVLGSQVNTRSSILGSGGRAKETQREFLVLMEDAIRTPDISKSVQRYQLAIDGAKVRLDFAVAPGCWLMPSRMVINTESVVGYNNKLKQATQAMKLGVNNNVNLETKKASLRHMDGGPTKINPPNSHPSNPIHKQATQAQGLAPKETPTPTQTPAPIPTTPTPTPTPTPQPDSHHVNKALIAGGALALAGVIAWFR